MKKVGTIWRIGHFLAHCAGDEFLLYLEVHDWFAIDAQFKTSKR